MKPSVWYTVEERQPAEIGYYVAFKGMSMGDGETGVDYFYWNGYEWRDSIVASIGRRANVRYWCDADPAEWYEQESNGGRSKKKRTVTEAEKAAWAAVTKAMEQYEIIRALTQ